MTGAAPPAVPRQRKRLDAFEAIYQSGQITLRRSVKGWRLLIAFIVVILPVGLGMLIRSEADAREQEHYFYGMLSHFHFGIAVPVVAMLLGTAFPWPEAEEGTLTFWFTSPIRRWHVLLGRFLASLILGSVVLPLCVLAIGLPLSTGPEAELGAVMRSAVTTTLLAYPAYLALFQCVATGLRRGLVFCVVFVLLENFISILSGTIVKLTLIFYVRSQVWPAVPKTSRILAEKALHMAEPASNFAAVSVFASVAVVALGLSLLMVEMIEYRGRTSQPG